MLNRLGSILLIPPEEAEVAIFQKYVTPHYRPKDRLLAMAVGAQSDHEERVIRAFYERTFNIS